MAKANEDPQDEQVMSGSDLDDPREQRDGRHAAGLRQRPEQYLEQREQFRAAEDYAPPAGEGARVNPDDQRSDPDGEAKPTA